MTESGRYLAKARESLASAEADFRARRYNSAANRSYYAAFQAAVAGLVWTGVRARGDDWSHRFVIDRYSVTLIRRKKLLPSRYRRVLDDLFDARVNADYSAGGVSRHSTQRGVGSASEIVAAVARMTEQKRTREASADYGSRKMTEADEYRKKAAGFIQEIEDTILSTYPDCAFEVFERTPKDYRMIVKSDSCDQIDIQDLLDGRKSDILVDHDIWIVLLVRRKEERAA